MVKKMLAVSTLLLLLSVPAMAAGGIELKAVAEVEVTVKNAKGEPELQRVEASTVNVAPGDAVIFSTAYENLGDQPATDVVITNPMPEHMLYLDGSAEGQGTRIELSVDNGKTFAPEGQLKVKDAEGKERPATAADYTHIRWTIEGALPPAAKGSVSFRAKVK